MDAPGKSIQSQFSAVAEDCVQAQERDEGIYHEYGNFPDRGYRNRRSGCFVCTSGACR